MNEITITKERADAPAMGVFQSQAGFEYWQRVAVALSKSDIIPEAYRDKVSNCMVALEISNRIGLSPFMVMQNLHVIKGKPSWSSTFIISALNSCGRFNPLRFKWEGEKKTDSYGCRAYTEYKDGTPVEGPLVSWAMVKSEGWLGKSGSKWKTMPELMFQYRAASFFGRLHAPDILNGMHSVEEVSDIVNTVDHDARREELAALFLEKSEHPQLPPEDRDAIDRIIENKEHAHYTKAIKQLEGLV